MDLLIWCQTCRGHYPADKENTWVHEGKLISKCMDCGTKTEAIIHISSSFEQEKKNKRKRIKY